MKLYKIYNNHEAYLSEEHGNFLMNLDVTLFLYNYQILKGWSSGYGHLHKNVELTEIITFYIYNKDIPKSGFASTNKYIFEIGLNLDKEVIDTRLEYDNGRDGQFEQTLLAQGMQESIHKLLEEII